MKKIDVKIELEFPVDFEGQIVKSLTMSRPKVSDQLTAEAGAVNNAGIEVALFATLTKQPAEFIEAMDFKDFLQLQAQYKSFLS